MPHSILISFVGEELKDQGGMIETLQDRLSKKRSLASELNIRASGSLRSRGCAVRLTDSENKGTLFWQPPLDPIPNVGPSTPPARDTIAYVATYCRELATLLA